MQHRRTPSQTTFPLGRAAIGRAVLPKLSLRMRLNRAMIGRYGTGIRNLFGSHRFHRSECRNHAQRSIFRNHSDFMQGYNSVAQENNHVGSPR